jgi:UDP-GlcNAc:undecaprenyl-phosphate GlcNAc-1-phosphate transferase
MTIIILILIFVFSVLISAAGNFLILNFAKTLGIRNKNEFSIRWSREAKPSLGGVSMYIVFLFSAVIILTLFLELLEGNQIQFLGIFVAGTVAFAMGVADDAYDTKPFMKMAVQIFCGILFVFTDNMVSISSYEWINALFTVAWVVTLMNSLNMLDNMDGITAITSVCILLSCLIIYSISHGWVMDIWTTLMICCIGTLVGFLIFNMHPSKIFMGDGGSQFIGVMIAFFTAKTLFTGSAVLSDFNYQGVILALVALSPAAVDTLSVVINRLMKGQSPMVGGKDHTTHHLVYSGKTDKQVGYVFLVLGLLSVGMTYLIYQVAIFNSVLSFFIGLTYFLSVFYFLYRNTIKYQAK